MARDVDAGGRQIYVNDRATQGARLISGVLIFSIQLFVGRSLAYAGCIKHAVAIARPIVIRTRICHPHFRLRISTF